MKHEKTSGKMIEKSEAAKMVKLFKDKNPKETHSVYFGRDHFEKMLSLAGCSGLRVHFAIGESGSNTVVIVPVDEAGSSIESRALEFGVPCPPICPPTNF